MHKITASYLSKIVVLALIVIVTPLLIGATPLPFTVKNSTNEALGTVTLHQLTGSIEINVTCPGNWVTPIELPISAVTVNNQLVLYPLSATITLPVSGHRGRIIWTNPHTIEIIDYGMGS